MARLAPLSDSKVRSMRSSRAWVSTWMVTSSGIWPPSINSRTKSKSVCEAEGKPTSISFRPTATRHLKKRIFFCASIGSISDWLPSRRSVDSQIGARSMILSGQVRSGRVMDVKGRYLLDGLVSMVMGEILFCILGGLVGRQYRADERGGASVTQSLAYQTQTGMLSK